MGQLGLDWTFLYLQHPTYGMAPDQLSLNGYYPAGYPVQYEPDSRVINYKNVVKELEDAKRWNWGVIIPKKNRTAKQDLGINLV